MQKLIFRVSVSMCICLYIMYVLPGGGGGGGLNVDFVPLAGSFIPH